MLDIRDRVLRVLYLVASTPGSFIALHFLSKIIGHIDSTSSPGPVYRLVNFLIVDIIALCRIGDVLDCRRLRRDL